MHVGIIGGIYMSRLALLVFLICFTVFGNIDVAHSTPGIYPDAPAMYSPVNYFGGQTVTFSVGMLNSDYYGGGYPDDYYIELYDADWTLVTSGWTGGISAYSMPGFDDDGATYYWRVLGEYQFSDGTDETYWSGYQSFVNGPSAIPSQPVLSLSPTSGAGTSVTLYWDADRATDYHLQVATDANFTSYFGDPIIDEWEGDYIGTTLSYLPDDGTIIYWRVAAKNSRGTTSYSSRSFVNGPSAAPSQPVLSISPTSGAGTSVTLYWDADRASDYHLQVATDANFTSYFGDPIIDEWEGDYIGTTLNYLPDDGTTIYWRVAAKNSLGTTSYSSRSFVNGPSAAPSQPVLSISPTSGAGTSVTLYWDADRASDYHLQVATDANFTSYFGDPIIDEWEGDYIGTTLSYLPDDGTTIYWRVAAQNSRGTTSYTSRSFVNGPSAIPSQPVLSISPTSGAGTSVTLYWDADRATDYHLQVATDANFTSYFGDPIIDEWEGDYIGTTLSYLPDDGTTIYWRVAAQNSLGTTSYTSRSFVNGPSAIPTQPVLSISPTSGAGNTVTLYWDADRATDYHLQVATDANFTSYFGDPIIDEWEGDFIGTTLSYLPDDGTTIYWRVAAQNPLGTTSYSSSYFINGPSSVPTQPVLSISPTSGSGTSVTLYWDSYRASDYHLQVATDANFTSYFGDPIIDEWEGDYIGTTLDYLPDDGSSIYWRVAAKNSLGTTAYTTSSFVNGPSAVPSQPVLSIFPTNGAGSEVLLSWDSSRASDYHLQVATNANFTSYSGGSIIDEWTGNYDAIYIDTADIGETIYWRVAAKNSLGTTSYSSSNFINGPSGAPPTPTQTSPGSSAGGDAIDFTWSLEPRADDYRLRILAPSGAVFFDEWLGDYNGIQIIGFDDIGGTYSWQVQAKNRLYASDLSAVRTFVNGPSASPPTPAPVYPLPGAIEGGANLSFQWTLVDRASDYRLVVSSSSNGVIFDQWLGNVDGTDVPGFKDIGETYTWQVQARNTTYQSSLSNPQSLINGPSGSPIAPTPVGPLATSNEGGVTVSFQWTPVLSANDYRLVVAKETGGVIFDQWLGNVDGFNLPGFKDIGETYTWQVQAKNSSYPASPFSTSQVFVNGPSNTPVIPTQIYPAPGDNAGGESVPFQWSQVVSADSYRLLVTTESGNVFFDQWLGDVDGVDLPGFADTGETFTWQVQAENISYRSDLSAGRTFINGPSTISVAPAQIIPFQGENAPSATVSFQWTPLARADNYRLLVTSVSTGEVFYDNWLGDVDGTDLPGFGDIGESYTWQVQAKIGTSSPGPLSTPPWTFVNGPSDVVPDAPDLFAPANGSNTGGTTVNFSWDAAARADSYIIQVATDSLFINIVKQVAVSGTSTTLSDFSLGSTYYWHVAGVAGTATGPYSFIYVFTSGTLNKNTESPLTCIQAAGCSSINVATGALFHDQGLFTTNGSPLSMAIELFYNSLPSYSGSMGLNWSHTYDIKLLENSDGSITLRDGSGSRSSYALDGNAYTSPAGDFSTLTKNIDNSYTITYRDGRKYYFRQDGKIVSIADRYTNAITFNYDTNGDLTTITDPAKRNTFIAYDQTTTPHRITAITDPNGKTYDFSYQGNTLWKVINPAADPAVSLDRGYWEYQYDEQGHGLLKSKKDPNGNISRYTYYTNQRVESAIDPDGFTNPVGHTRSYTYPTNTGSLRTTTFTEKDNAYWFYTYDVINGVLKDKTDPNGKNTHFTYYLNGNLKSTTDPKDGAVRLTTFFTYDGYGNILTQTEPVNLTPYAIDPENVADPATLVSLSPLIKPAISYIYEAATSNNIIYDRITSVSDLRGTTPLTTSFAYTAEDGGDVVTATAPGNIVTITKFYPNGTVKEIIDANQKSTTFSYYPNTTANQTAGIVGLLQSTTSPAGIVTTVTSYDKDGNPQEMTVKDTAGTVRLTSSQQHDALNRLKQLTKTATGLPAIISKFGYDKVGNLNSLIDAEQHETKYEYNYNRQVKTITDAKKKNTIFGYGSVDKLVAVYDANATQNSPLASQPHTAYQYDQLGRLDTESDPLNKKLHYTYYDNGQLKEIYDATSAMPGTLLVTNSYNNRGQLTDRTFTDGGFEHYTYTDNGQLETATNQNISYTYVYYPDGRLHTVTDTTNTRQISYDEYDGLGQRKKMTILKGAGTDERIITYDYDTANRPWHITSTAGTFIYDYDNLGRRHTLEYPNSTITQWDFDNLNRLTSLQNKVTGGAAITSFNFTEFDKVGNRKSVTGSKNETYVYDELYRLLSVTSTKPETFQYDAVGNRQLGPGQEDSVYVHNAANQMTQGRKVAYTYDNRGNQIGKTVPGASNKSWVQEWDYNNRLTKVEKSSGADKRTVTFKYDPFGNRIEKNLVTFIKGVYKTQKWDYIFDNNSIAVEIFTDENNQVAKTYYTHGPDIDEHLAMERGGSFYYYNADGLGSIVSITDASHALVQSYQYDSHGMVQPSTGFRNNLTFAGKEYDWETGYVEMGVRYYDPIEGRFLSRDPIGVAGGINQYSYVGGNAVNLVDPLGLFESHPILRLLVPGQVAFDNAMTSYETGDYLGTAINAVSMAGEQVLSVFPFGKSASLATQGSKCVTANAPTYTRSSLQLGQKMHKEYKLGAEGIKEFRLPSGKRIDFLDISNGIVHELKPFNPRAMKAGQKQLQMYINELKTMPQFKGIDWKSVLDTY